MASYVPAELRRFVAARADYLCEYCLIHEEDRGFGCQIDHIISEKHGGTTDADNLAYACAPCNRTKGSNIAPLIRSQVFFQGSTIPASTNGINIFNLADRGSSV